MLWFEVAKIDPARDRTFDEVKDKVEAQWRADEVTRALGAKALDMVKQLDAGATLASLAEPAGLEVKSAADIRRNGGWLACAERRQRDLRHRPMGPARPATPSTGASSSRSPPIRRRRPSSTIPTQRRLADRLNGALQTSLVEQYVTAIEHELGVTIHQNVLQAAEGG